MTWLAILLLNQSEIPVFSSKRYFLPFTACFWKSAWITEVFKIKLHSQSRLNSSISEDSKNLFSLAGQEDVLVIISQIKLYRKIKKLISSWPIYGYELLPVNYFWCWDHLWKNVLFHWKHYLKRTRLHCVASWFEIFCWSILIESKRLLFGRFDFRPIFYLWMSQVVGFY